MPSFLLLYRGPPGDAMSAPPDQQKAVMDAWTAYFTKHGPAVTDMGNPTLPGVNMKPGGKTGSASDVTGYSILSARDMAAARAIVADRHPHLGDAKNSIDVFEIMPVM